MGCGKGGVTTIKLLNIEPLQKTGQNFLQWKNPTTDAYLKEIKSVYQDNICILLFTTEYS